MTRHRPTTRQVMGHRPMTRRVMARAPSSIGCSSQGHLTSDCTTMIRTQCWTLRSRREDARVRARARTLIRANPDNRHPSLEALRESCVARVDIGTMTMDCSMCNAMIWRYEVHQRSSTTTTYGKYCCHSGRVNLSCFTPPPPYLHNLLIDNAPAAVEFRKNIRAYNTILSFASMGVQIDEKISQSTGIYSFRIHGAVYHHIGSLTPDLSVNGQQRPQFAQMYIYDAEHELHNRLGIMPKLNSDILLGLQMMLHNVNPYVYRFIQVRNYLTEDNSMDLCLVIHAQRELGHRYAAPQANEVAALLVGSEDRSGVNSRDIVLQKSGGGCKRISNRHPAYMPCHYVLLFPYGDDGWHDNICPSFLAGLGRRDKVSMMQFYAYHLQVRPTIFQGYLCAGRLFQQFIVDAYASLEQDRLSYIRQNQQKLRCELYQGLQDLVNRNDHGEPILGSNIGRRIVLPASFTNSPRQMHRLYQDAMAIVRCCGKPDLFITFTCNPNWIEIQRELQHRQTAGDRPDLVARVFNIKHHILLDDLIKRGIFGRVIGYIYVIEFQKRGLPHSHILLILHPNDKPRTITNYDQIVNAELPCVELHPQLHETVSKFMIHGPCGSFNQNATCMKDGKCTKKYPRVFNDRTKVGADGYPTYMRRNNGQIVTRKGDHLDNRWVVPYNPYLAFKYNSHVNVEICSTVSAVKYMYKYVYKGHDKATFSVQRRLEQHESLDIVDEIEQYLDARYVSASEGCWRLLGFHLHDEKPDIQHLQIHLPDCQPICFSDQDDARTIMSSEDNKKTTLTEWFTCNQRFVEAQIHTYQNFPIHWVWNGQQKAWHKRTRGNTIGRIYFVSPSAGERYYLCLLLTIVCGAKSFADLKTFDGIVHTTFQATCMARGLLETDAEWDACLVEATLSASGGQMRQLFVTILLYCDPSNPSALWEKHNHSMIEDFVHRLQQEMPFGNHAQILMQAQNMALLHVANLLEHQNKSLCDYPGMPFLDVDVTHDQCNPLIVEERAYDQIQMQIMSLQMEAKLNTCQHAAYDLILNAVFANTGQTFFLDGPGGSGKTFLYKTLLAKLRGSGHVALAVASSGIAALLLPGGRTAHSRFKIPLQLNEASTCNISKQSHLAGLIQLSSLIIWDEAPMSSRYAFECLDRSLRDIMQGIVEQAEKKPFGGKVVLLGGDFRQILPIVKKGRRQDIVNITLCRSYIWSTVHILRLTENMRVQSTNDVFNAEYVQWLLKVGDGTLRSPILEYVQLPQFMLLHCNTLQGLINFVYEDIGQCHVDNNYFASRAIMAPRNEDVDEVNESTLMQMQGDAIEYISADSLAPGSELSHHNFYPIEYLNSMNLGGGFPPHMLRLKPGCPVMLLQNLDPLNGLCNGTRMVCVAFHKKVIEAEVVTGTHIGQRAFIPRVTFIPSTEDLPFSMRRRQFPLRVAFGMTINKSQGQTMSRIGVLLRTSIFSHGQLYVALSRASSPENVRVVTENVNMNSQQHESMVGKTTNIVYREILQQTSSS